MKYDPIRVDAARYPFAMAIAPRFADMDILKHLNNLALAEFHEEARVRFLTTLFGDDFLFRKRDYRLLVARATYDYLREAHYPHPLEARVGVARIGNTSFELALALFQQGQCVCLCDVIGVAAGENGPTPLTEELRREFEKNLLRRD